MGQQSLENCMRGTKHCLRESKQQPRAKYSGICVCSSVKVGRTYHPYTQIAALAEALLFCILLRGWKVSHPATAACITVARLVGAHEA